MKDEDQLYLFFRELNRLETDGKITHSAMEQLLKPISNMNEKKQDEYAQEMRSVLRTSADEQEILLRSSMCLQMMAEESVFDKGAEAKQSVKKSSGGKRKTVISEEDDDPETDSKTAAGLEADGSVYVSCFELPIDMEEQLLSEQGTYNGGKFAYVDNAYPCGIFSGKQLKKIAFAPITVFYGGNGSGKSTLLNLIANRLELNRIAPYNSGELFERYRDACEYSLGTDEEGFKRRIPSGSRIITSDDVFDYMLTMRTRNDEISEGKQAAREDYARLKYGENVKFRGMEDYEALRLQVQARSKSVTRRKFILKNAGEEVKLGSNGETALEYFRSKVKSKTLYCLDEPENSLSPALQLELVKLLEQKAYEEECQLILSTHSPFLLAMNGARVYDLDQSPVCVKPWWKLENARIYFEFFEKNRGLFLEE